MGGYQVIRKKDDLEQQIGFELMEYFASLYDCEIVDHTEKTEK